MKDFLNKTLKIIVGLVFVAVVFLFFIQAITFLVHLVGYQVGRLAVGGCVGLFLVARWLWMYIKWLEKQIVE